jgi:hypothetical protein
MARTVELTKGYVAIVSNRDYRRVMTAGTWHANVSSKNKTIYAECSFRQTDGTWHQVKMHRFILSVTDSKVEVDHRDRNGLNNTRRNLRKATRSQNARNKSMQVNNTTGVSGVTWHKHRKKYQVNLGFQGKQLYFGLFGTLEEATRVVQSAKKKLHKSFARFV